MLEFVLLGFLMYMPMSGYQMKQTMANTTANFLDASFGSIYPALKRLEGKALVTGEDRVEGGKFIRRYSMTQSGREAFLDWLRQPAEVTRASNNHLAKLFFYGHLDQETREQHYRHYIRSSELEQAKLRELATLVEPHADAYQFATLTWGIKYYQFLQECYQSLLEQSGASNAQLEGGISSEICSPER